MVAPGGVQRVQWKPGSFADAGRLGEPDLQRGILRLAIFVYHQAMHSELQSGRRVRALGPQSTVGVVSPASCVDRSALEAGCRALRTLSGWQVETSPAALQREGDFAGTPASRAAALMEMWQRDDVDAMLCARGGYGSNYLLPLLDFDALRR